MRLVPWVARPPEHVCSLALQWLFLPVRRPPPWGLLLSWALQYRICCGLSPALGLRVCWCPPVVGGAATLLADIVGRFVLQPNELEMSIVLAIGCAPFMVAAVRRRRGVSGSKDAEVAV